MAQHARAVLGCVAVAVAVLGGACGGDGDRRDGGVIGGGVGGGSATTIEARASEFEFRPARWTVPAGEEVAVELENEGTLAHEWVVIALGGDIASEAELTDDVVLFQLGSVPPGEREEGTFTVDRPGTYQVICSVTGHFAAGMEGELVAE